MAEEFRIALGVELTGNALDGVRSELQSLTGTQHTIDIRINNQVETQIDRIRTQLLDLQRININLGRNGGQRRGAVDEINRAYRELQSIQKRLSDKAVKLEGLDTRENINQINELRQQITSLREDYNSIFNQFGNQFSDTQIDNITRSMDVFEEKFTEVQAKLRDSSAIEEVNNAYRELQSIQKRIGDKTEKINTLNLSEDLNQIDTLRNQIVELGQEYNAIFNRFGNQFSDVQSSNLTSGMDVLREKLETIQAKFRDVISNGLNTGEFEGRIANLQAGFNKLGASNDEVSNSILRIRNAYDQLIQTNLSGDVNQLTEAYCRFIQELDNGENALKRFKRAHDASMQMSDRNLLSQDIEIWMKDNAAAADKFSDKLTEIQRQLRECDNVDLKGLKKEFNQIKKEAELSNKGFSGLFGDLVNQFSDISNIISASEIIMYSFQALKEGITTVKELDTALVDLKKTTEASSKEVNNFYLEANDIAKKYGATTQEIIQSAADWSRLGFNLNDSKLMSQYSSMFKSISPNMNIDEATNGLVSIMKAYGIEAEDALDGIISKINIVGNEFATSNSDIVAGLQNSAAAMAVMGTSLEETIALFTSAQEITQNASKVGRIVAQIFGNKYKETW